jgi:hypothetical protein
MALHVAAIYSEGSNAQEVQSESEMQTISDQPRIFIPGYDRQGQASGLKTHDSG